MAEKHTNNQGVVLFYREGMPGEKAAAEKLASMLAYAGVTGKERIVGTHYSGGAMSDEVSETLKRKGFSKALLAGVTPKGFFQAADVRRTVAEKAGLTESSLALVSFPQRMPEDEDVVSGLLDEITRAYRVLEMTPGFTMVEAPVTRSVLVLGGGFAGVQTAMELIQAGFAVTIAEKSQGIGGGNPLFKADAERLEGVTVYTGCELTGLAGSLGAFTAALRRKDESDNQYKTFSIECGAVVLAVGSAETDKAVFPVQSPLLVSLDGLQSLVLKMKSKSKMLCVGIFMDYAVPETPASMERALQTALALQKQYERQVTIYLRDAKVSALQLEQLYGMARDAGVVVVKYEGTPAFTETDEGLNVELTDCILGETITERLDIAGISPRGLSAAADKKALAVTGVFPDSLGQAQENNIHAFSVETNIPGIAAVGSCRGTHYLPRITEEARAAALYLRDTLRGDAIFAESSQAVVDPDKCVLCLTCIRSCPMGAMGVNREKGAAESLAHVCRRCGICAGECPAKAIELPVYSDKALLYQAVQG